MLFILIKSVFKIQFLKCPLIKFRLLQVIDTYAKLLKTGVAVEPGFGVKATILTTFAWVIYYVNK